MASMGVIILACAETMHLNFVVSKYFQRKSHLNRPSHFKKHDMKNLSNVKVHN